MPGNAYGATQLGALWDGVNAQSLDMVGDPGAAAAAFGYTIVRQRGTPLFGAIDPAANTGGTITLAAGGAGTFHMITHMRFVRAATAALAGTALLTVTTTNLGGRQWRVGNAMIAGGTQIDLDEIFVSPVISAVANTASTIVFPAPGAAVAWSAIVEYYLTVVNG